MANITVSVTDANNITVQLTPVASQTITIDRGVAGNGISSIVPVTISTLQYLRIFYTNGTQQDVGPLTSTAYAGVSPIDITGNTISLLTVPINKGGTNATTAAAAIENLLPSYTGNGSKRLSLNSGATALEWVLDGGGTVTSVDVSGGTTGLTTSGGPITGSGTITLAGTLAVANGGTGVITSTGTGSVVLSTSPSLVTPLLGTPTSGNFSTGTFTWPTFNQNTTGTAAGLSATLVIASGGTNGTATPTAGAVPYGTGTAYAFTAAGTAGQILQSNGASAPTWANLSSLGVSSFSAGTTGFTPSTATTGAVTLAGTLATTNGGTGLTSFTANGIVYASSTSALATNSALTFDGSTFAVTGLTTVTSSGNSSVTTGIFANTSTGTSAINRFRLNGGTSSAFFEMQGSGFSGTNITNGPTTSALVVWTGSNIPVSIGVNASEIGRFSSTGLAVTGALSVSASVASATLASSGAYSALSFTNSGGAAASGTILANSSGILQSRAATHAYTNADASSEYMRISGATGGVGAVGIGYSSLTSVGNNGLAVLGNVGIGTSSPGAKLEVYLADGTYVWARENSINKTVGYQIVANGGSPTAVFSSNTATGEVRLGGIATNYFQTFYTNNTERARIDTSGNLGLGVTPSADTLGGKKFEIGFAGNVIQGYQAANLLMYNNATFNSGWKYSNTAGVAYYQQTGSQHIWYNAPSGTAGNAITFTQAMTLDASGNLGIGTTSPAATKRLHVANVAAGSGMRVSGPTSDNNWAGGIEFYSDNATTTTSNILVSSGGMQFGYGGSERMRIDSSGNLLVGKTNTTGVNAGAVLTPSGGFTITRTGTSASDQVIFYRGTAGSEVYVGTITTTGTATSYVTSSDYRLKNTIAPMTGALAKVAALKPVTYKWNADGSDGEGFIAHELAEVVPQSVTGEKDALDADGNPKYQGIDTSFLVATITAAIQEQQAIIQSLTARITALEGA